jgi:hypothetical protein
MILKPRQLLLLIAVSIITRCMSSGNVVLIQSLENRLNPLIGQDPESIASVVTDELGFRILAKWAGMDPTPEMVIKNTPRQVSFSPKEALGVFREKGFYDVMTYVRSGGEEKAHVWDGEPGEYLTYHDHTYNARSCILARLVFRDKKLQDFKLIRANVAS